MTNHGRTLLFFALVASVAAARGVAAAPADTAVVWVAADGSGAVDLLWSPLGAWPAGGFRLERLSDGGKAETVADRVRPLADPETSKALGPVPRTEIERLAADLVKGGETARRAAAQAFLRGAAVPEVGRALGLRVTDEGGSGPRRYRLSGLGAKGEVLWRVETETLDPGRVTPALPAPGDFAATLDGAAVRLRWTPPRGERLSALTFTVERRSGGEVRALTRGPTIPGRVKGDTHQGFRDDQPPLGAEATYLLTLYDALGRPSPPAEVTIRVPDLASLSPPEGVVATAEPGRIVVTWKAKTTAGTLGYVLERAHLEHGPFTPVRGEPLPARAARHVDEDVTAETVYYYRLRSQAKGGTSGEPSPVAWAEAPAKASPTPPQGLAAEVGRTRVRLTWKPVPGPLSGYLVERQTASGRWARLNPDYSTEPRFDDHLGPQDAALLSYRVATLSHRGKLSAPSAPLAVRLRDAVPPPVPRLVALRQDAAGVRIEFQPAAPAEATTAFRILRSEKRSEPGLVLGPALPASARSFQDPSARPGKAYFYRVVAVDEAGNRSVLSEPLRQVVARPVVPKAPPPQVDARPKPFPHVRVRHAAPPPGLSVVVERRVAGQESFVVLGTLTEGGGGFLDALPAVGKQASYRVVYRDGAGAQGAPSAAVEITVPGP